MLDAATNYGCHWRHLSEEWKNSKMGKNLTPDKGDRVIDAKGCLVLPGAH